MSKYKVKMLINTNHLEVYFDNEFSIGLEYTSRIFCVNILFLKINIIFLCRLK